MSFAHLPGVIFDLGGVLLRWDTWSIVEAAFADESTRAAVHEAIFRHPDWLELDRGVLSEHDAVKRFAVRTGQPCSAMARLMDEVRRCLAPEPDVLDLLIDLDECGVPLYCLSNMHDRNTGYLTGRYDFFARFRDVIFSADVKMIKPEPAIYRYAQTRFGLTPETCVFVDDSPANVSAARQAGWHAVQFRDAARCRADLETLATRWSG